MIIVFGHIEENTVLLFYFLFDCHLTYSVGDEKEIWLTQLTLF